MWNLKRNDTNEFTKQKETHRLSEFMVVGGGGIVRDCGKVMYTLIYLKWITNKTIVWHLELCSMLCASLDGRGVWGRMDTRIRMAESLCC